MKASELKKIIKNNFELLSIELVNGNMHTFTNKDRDDRKYKTKINIRENILEVYELIDHKYCNQVDERMYYFDIEKICVVIR